jgi:uncharacterized repeat protein (TIGR01451 family)
MEKGFEYYGQLVYLNDQITHSDMKNLYVALLGGCYAFSAVAQTPTVPAPTQTSQVITDPNGNNKADPNDKIRYKVTIQNTGTGNATGVQLNANPDTRTSLDAASFRSSPVAANDGPYACTGNVGINIPAASGLKSNDFDDDLANATLSVITNPTNGALTLNNDGSFTYTPNAGYSSLTKSTTSHPSQDTPPPTTTSAPPSASPSAT